MAHYEAARRILGKPPRIGVEDLKTESTQADAAIKDSGSTLRDGYYLTRDAENSEVYNKENRRVGVAVDLNGSWVAYSDGFEVTKRGNTFLFGSEYEAVSYIKHLAEKSLVKYQVIPDDKLPTGDEFSASISLVLGLRYGNPGGSVVREESSRLAELLVRNIEEDSITDWAREYDLNPGAIDPITDDIIHYTFRK